MKLGSLLVTIMGTPSIQNYQFYTRIYNIFIEPKMQVKTGKCFPRERKQATKWNPKGLK